MPVTREDVLHIASLARIRVDEGKVETLARELSSILGHIEVLASVDTADVQAAVSADGAGTPLREDSGPPEPLCAPLESFAPEMRHGFFVVPRLATHEDSPDSAA